MIFYFFILALECEEDQFGCVDNQVVVKCISLTYVCDGMNDCPHKADEIDCPPGGTTSILFSIVLLI